MVKLTKNVIKVWRTYSISYI